MREKVIGYILLGLGIVVMATSIYLVFMVFTGDIQPIQVFKEAVNIGTKQEPLSLQDMVSNPSALTEMQSQMLNQIIDKQINKTTNIFATVFLMYLIMLLGFRLSTLGVQLMRPIVVKLNAAKEDKYNIPPKPPLQ